MVYGSKYDEDFLRDTCAPIRPDVVIDIVPKKSSVDLYMKYFPCATSVFFCSSTGTFVPLQYYPADERHRWNVNTGKNFYDQCERDSYAFQMYHEHGFPITVFRPTNIIGPGRIPLDLWGDRRIEFFQMLKASKPVSIYPCESILLQSGYNWDLASAFVKAIDKPEQVRGELFIISSAKAIMLGDYLKTAMEYLNSKSEIIHCSREELFQLYPDMIHEGGLNFMLLNMCFDISKAKNVLGYQPVKTAQEGLVESLEWCERNGWL